MSIANAAAEVLGVEPQPLPYYTISLRVAAIFADVVPGQFVMIQTDPLDPYLRRAFSVFDVSKASCSQERRSRGCDPLSEKGSDADYPERKDPERREPVCIELLGKVIGPGTRRLAALAPPARPALLGPLGRGFSWSAVEVMEPASQGQDAQLPHAALVAGGVGSAGLLLLARALADSGVAFDFYYGGRTADDLACSERFEKLSLASGGKLVATTEDGSAGQKGVVTEPLQAALESGRYRALYTCGPLGLMRRVAELGKLYEVPGQAALEAPMGCGYGACIGCVVPHTSGRYALCCKEGPVFAFDEVDWDRVV